MRLHTSGRQRSTPRAALFALAAVVAAPIATSCRIFAVLPVPCTNDNDVQECGDDEVCVNNVCVLAPPTPEACTPEGTDAPNQLRTLDVEVSEPRGMAAMAPMPFGAVVDVTADFSCAPACDAVGGTVPKVRAPLVDEVSAAGLGPSASTIPNSTRDTMKPFVLEAVFRSPTVSGATIAGAFTSTDDGWRMETAGSSTRLRFGSSTHVTLLKDGAGVWSYVLCIVDGTRLAERDPGGLLCSIDGEMRAPPTSVDAISPTTAPLVVGGTQSNDGAIAFVRTWTLPASSKPMSDAGRLAQLATTGRQRLVSYVGIRAHTAGHVHFANQGDTPRVVELPAVNEADRAVAWVGGSWPRLVKVIPTIGADRTEAIGIQFEPRSVNLLQDIGPSCATRLGPTGRVDACALKDDGTQGASLSIPTNIERNTAFIFSVFVPSNTPSLDLVFEQSETTRFQCRLLPQGTRSCADDFTESQAEVFGAWTRISWSTSFAFPVTRVRFLGSNTTTVWAPQVEVGVRATSPIAFRSATGQTAAVRVADAMVLDRVELGLTDALSVSATLLDAVKAAQPVVLLDDDDEDDGILRLSAELSDPEGSGALDFAVTLDGRVSQQAVSSAVVAETETGVVGGHIGKGTTPLQSCAPCTETEVVASNALDLQKVRIAGPHAVLKSVHVAARGRSSEPTALFFEVNPWALDTCSEDVTLFTFAGCADGPCAAALADTPWDSSSLTTPPHPSAFPGEFGLAGRRMADLFGRSRLGTLLLEARFQSPRVSDASNVISLKGPQEAGIRLERNETGRFVVLVRAGDAEVPLTEVAPGEWNQVICLFDAPAHCIVNLGDPVALEGVSDVTGEGLVSVAVGDDNADTWVSFAHGSAVRGAPDSDEVDALLRQRAAMRFGLHVAERRLVATLREARTTPSFASVRDASGEHQLMRIGSSWPRIEDGGFAAAYVSGPGGANAFADAWKVNAASRTDVGSGPHDDIEAILLPAGELKLGPVSSAGVVSVFIAKEDLGGNTSAPNDVNPGDVVLQSGAQRVTLDGAASETSGGVISYGPWIRLWLYVHDGAEMSFATATQVRAAALQFEPRATAPGAPALDGVLSGDALEIVSGDLSSEGGTVATLEVQDQMVGGPFLSFLRVVPGRTDIMSLERNVGEIKIYTQRRSGLTSIARTQVASLRETSDVSRMTLWWRAGDVLFSRADGSITLDEAPAFALPPNRLVVGQGHVRLHRLTVERGDLVGVTSLNTDIEGFDIDTEVSAR